MFTAGLQSVMCQLQAYIEKTLEYEQYAMPSDAFLGAATMVAGPFGTMVSYMGTDRSIMALLIISIQHMQFFQTPTFNLNHRR